MLKWVFPLALTLSLIGAVYAAYTSPDFVNCIQNKGQYETADSKKHEPTAAIIPPPSDYRVVWDCAGGYANANGIAITAIATFFLTIVTALLAYLAWDQTDTARRQLRAYVSAGAPFFGGKNPTSLTIKVENGGQTPAYKLGARLNRKWVPKDEGLPLRYHYPDIGAAHPNASIITLHPGKDYTFTFEFDPTELDRVRRGESDLFLYGYIEYRDTFRRRRITNFCYQYFALMKDGADTGHRIVMTKGNNDAT